ncbi:MAG: type II toxin-antitoxin system Phd/YefM family antitoxin [Solirubrobacterales bacterium]
MTFAAVSEIKARLSEYLARVRGGEEVVVTDRGRPVARIVPVSDRAPNTEELERRGLIRRPSARLPRDFLDLPRPRLAKGSSLVDAVVEERREGR